MKMYVVIGLGRFGKELSTSLFELGEEVLAIDKSGVAVDEIADFVTHSAAADARNKNVLTKLGVQNADCAIVTCASDLASSILVTMNLKTIGVKNVICKANDETHAEILKKIGADRVIMPEKESARKLSENLVSPNIAELIDLSNDYGIVEVAVPKKWIGTKIVESNIRAKYGVTVIAVKNNGKLIISPSIDYVFSDNDIIVILGSYSEIENVAKIK